MLTMEMLDALLIQSRHDNPSLSPVSCDPTGVKQVFTRGSHFLHYRHL